MKKTILILAMVASIPSLASAGEIFGKIVQFKRDVTVVRTDSGSSEKVNRNDITIFVGDSIKTGERSKVYIILEDTSRLIVNEKTTFKAEKIHQVRVNKGSALFKIARKVRKITRRQFRVKTPTAIIGVKGTQYMVQLDERGTNVFVKSGRVSAESPTGGLIKYYNTMENEFHTAIKEAEKEYSDFKKQAEEEYAEMVKSLDIKAGQAITISSRYAKPIVFSISVKEQFNELDTF